MHEDLLTFAIGDIHGCVSKLECLEKVCREYAGSRPHRVITVGDYIDRGSDSRGVVHLLRRWHREMDGRMICLRGNHEEMLSQALNAPGNEMWWIWLSKGGGAETLRSYEAQTVTDLPQDDVYWLTNRELFFDDGLRLFVHAGVDPSRSLATQTHHLLWAASHDDSLLFDRFVVHGHFPSTDGKPDLRANRLNVDTGAVYGGPLTAAIFEPMRAPPIAFITHSGELTKIGE